MGNGSWFQAHIGRPALPRRVSVLGFVTGPGNERRRLRKEPSEAGRSSLRPSTLALDDWPERLFSAACERLF